HAVAFGMKIVGSAAVPLDEAAGTVSIAVGVATVRRGARTRLRSSRAEALSKDHVHDLLVGAITIFECDFFRQDLDTLNRLSGNVAQFPKSRDALPVEKQYRGFAAAAARAPDLWRQSFKQLSDVGRAGRTDIARVERIFRRNIADYRAPRARAGNDDLFLVTKIVRRLGCGCTCRRSGVCRCGRGFQRRSRRL